MTLLIIGVVLFIFGHMFRRIAPGLRESMGLSGRAVVSIVLAVALVLMVIGYRQTPPGVNVVQIPGNGHINNTLMLVALIVFGAGMSKGWLWTKIRHPMLWGTLIWAVAHLIVHNDQASIILFGGMGLWSILSMVAINRRGAWERPASGGVKRDLVLVVVALIMYGVITGIHMALGMNPFMGNIA